jgi:hypothetical protein
MQPAAACPKCGYARKATDTAPAWQCPGCGIAIEKFLAALRAPRAAPLPLERVPAQLPVERRLGSAIPDLLMAALFLWCWLNPTAWRPTLAAELGLLMLMEFFVVHASIFLVAGGGPGQRWTTATLVVLFYVPVAGAFAWWQGGWWPVLGFVALLASRVATMLAGQGDETFEAKRGRYYWVQGAAIYILVLFVAVLLPMPELGFHRMLQRDYRLIWPTTWRVGAHEVMAWGFLYFSGQALLKLLERPEWILEAPATSERPE